MKCEPMKFKLPERQYTVQVQFIVEELPNDDSWYRIRAVNGTLPLAKINVKVEEEIDFCKFVIADVYPTNLTNFERFFATNRFHPREGWEEEEEKIAVKRVLECALTAFASRMFGMEEELVTKIREYKA